MTRAISLSFVGLVFQIECGDSVTERLVSQNFGTGASRETPAARYSASWSDGLFVVTGPQADQGLADTDSDFLYLVEKAITLEAQRLRPDLYFVHAAAVAKGEEASLLIGRPGAGKSTLTWALLHHGWSYLSDELAPIDLPTLTVYPYSHALCLKQEPPSPYGLPPGALATSATIHIPVEHLPSNPAVDRLPIRNLVFVSYDSSAISPSLSRLSKAEGAARLYSNTLNLLAHPDAGLEAAASIANGCTSLALTSASLEETCRLIGERLTSVHDVPQT